MALILATDSEIIVADDSADMARKLTALLDDEPEDDTLTYLVAVVLGCDALDVIITRTDSP